MFDTSKWSPFIDQHSSELLILTMFTLLMVTLVIVVPQLIRMHLQRSEMHHQEVMRALEKDQPLPSRDNASQAAGRTAMLVPMVVMICAGTVTCFMLAYKTESAFAITVSVWAVSGVVSLAAITGGVALIGRLADLKIYGKDADELDEPPLPEIEDN